MVNVLSSLEAHWHVLEAEVVEINRDIDYCEQCLRKYGEWFNSPLQYLRELKRTKKNKMKEIIRTMESFNNNLQGGKKLVKSLEKQTVRAPPLAHLAHTPLPMHLVWRNCLAGSWLAAILASSRLMESCSSACSQPVSVLQAPATPAVIAASGGDDAPAMLVGSAMSHQGHRVIRPTET